MIAAARAIYNRAIADGHVEPGASPAHRVAEPRRFPSTRRALTAHELDQINAAARTSDDVVLDALLLRLHTGTACRRSGAPALRLADLDTDNCLIQLREKGSTVRWRPVSPALAASLSDHAACRGAVLPTDLLGVLLHRDPDVELLNQRGQRVSADRAGLESLLDAAHRDGRIALDAKAFLTPVRNFLNHIHPRRQHTEKFMPDHETVSLCLGPRPRCAQRSGAVSPAAVGLNFGQPNLQRRSPPAITSLWSRYSNRYTPGVTHGEWQVYLANEVRDWLDALDAATHARVVHAIDALADAGPGLERPLVDTPSTDQPCRTLRN